MIERYCVANLHCDTPGCSKLPERVIDNDYLACCRRARLGGWRVHQDGRCFCSSCAPERRAMTLDPNRLPLSEFEDVRVDTPIANLPLSTRVRRILLDYLKRQYPGEGEPTAALLLKLDEQVMRKVGGWGRHCQRELEEFLWHWRSVKEQVRPPEIMLPPNLPVDVEREITLALLAEEPSNLHQAVLEVVRRHAESVCRAWAEEIRQQDRARRGQP